MSVAPQIVYFDYKDLKIDVKNMLDAEYATQEYLTRQLRSQIESNI